MKDELSKTIFHVLFTQFALENLRAKDIPRALEALEMALDLSVLQLHALAKDGDPKNREQVVSRLREVRRYRQAHPRQMESDLSTIANGVVGRTIRISKKRIEDILNEAE